MKAQRPKQKLAKAKVHVEGIVHGEAIAQPSNDWYVMFLMPWRHPDGRVIDQELRVAPDVSARVAAAAERSYRRGVAVRVTARQVTKERGFTYWNADEIAKVEKLRRLDLAEPEDVTERHALGRLTLDRGRGAFIGKRGRAELVIDRLDGLLAAATARVLAIEAKHAAIRKAIAKELVPLYNDEWREKRRSIDASAFDRQLKLSAIYVGEKRTTLYYTTGALFADHGAEVRLTVRGAISEILIS